MRRVIALRDRKGVKAIQSRRLNKIGNGDIDAPFVEGRNIRVVLLFSLASNSWRAAHVRKWHTGGYSHPRPHVIQ